MTTTPNLIAQTILAQLGGHKFTVMTGAKSLSSHPEGALSFRIPGGGGFAKSGINYVKVTLTPRDTYTVEFSRIRARQVTRVAQAEDIYADQLRDVFTRETGLRTSLF